MRVNNADNSPSYFYNTMNHSLSFLRVKPTRIEKKRTPSFFGWSLKALLAMLITTVSVLATVPNKPTNVNLTYSNQTKTLTLSWNAPSGGGTPTGYKVYFDEDTDNQVVREYDRVPNYRLMKTVNSTATSTTLSFDDFSTYSIYRVLRVAAYNNSGEGSKSEAEYFYAYTDHSTGDIAIATGDGNGDFMFESGYPVTNVAFDINDPSQSDTLNFTGLAVKIPMDNTATISYSLVDAPAGMTIDPATGNVTWISPKQIGRFTATHVATWETMRKERTLTVEVFRSPNTVFTNTAPVVIKPNTAYTFNHDAKDNTDPNAVITYSLQNEPDGMTIDPVTGIVSYPNTSLNDGEFVNYTVGATSNTDNETRYEFVSMMVIANRIKAYASYYNSTVYVNQEITPAAQFGIFATDIGGEDTVFNCRLINAPEGMTIAPYSRGTFASYISWTPKEVGTFKFQIEVTGTKAWGKELVEFEITVTDQLEVIIDPPRFVAVGKKMKFTPVIRYKSGKKVEDITFEGINYEAFRFDIFDGGVPDSLENGTVSFNSTDGTIEWTPSGEGYFTLNGVINYKGQFVSSYVFYTYAVDFSKRDTAEVMFNTYPTTGIKPNQQWSYTPSLTNRFTYRSISGTYKLKAGPQGVSLDASTGTFTWTPTEKGIYSFIIEAEAENGKKTLQPFMVLVAEYFEPVTTKGSFSQYPANWAYVGQSFDSSYFELPIDWNRFQAATLDSLQGTEPLDLEEVRYTLEVAAPGMTLDSQTGALTWTPTEQGVWDVVVKAYHPTRGGVARMHLSFFAFDMPKEEVTELVRGRRSGVSKVDETPESTPFPISIAPLPAVGTINVAVPMAVSGSEIRFRITDIAGNTLLQTTEQALQGGRYSINLDRIAQGMYLLVVEQNNQRSATPLVIVR
jgi:hypothetical protein